MSYFKLVLAATVKTDWILFCWIIDIEEAASMDPMNKAPLLYVEFNTQSIGGSKSSY